MTLWLTTTNEFVVDALMALERWERLEAGDEEGHAHGGGSDLHAPYRGSSAGNFADADDAAFAYGDD